MGYSGNLVKMKLTGYKNCDFTGKVGDLTVLINPEKYAHNYRIEYNDKQAQGSSGGSPDFNKIPPETVEFDLVFDATGVVPSPVPGVPSFSSDGITKQIADLKKLVFKFNGVSHSPNFVELVWGDFIFRCRLQSLNINYTLFKPDATPLRARLTLNFASYTSEEQLAKQANTNSPDLSHVLTVKAGDTLPLMCYGVYGSSVYYPQVARVNGLTDFRNLVLGAQLLFPPLGAATQ